jgi:hypothetical protein
VEPVRAVRDRRGLDGDAELEHRSKNKKGPLADSKRPKSREEIAQEGLRWRGHHRHRRYVDAAQKAQVGAPRTWVLIYRLRRIPTP